MENNRRSFFKGMAAFAAGVVGAKVASYVPKKEEPKEELQVAESVVVKDEKGNSYNMVVVPKKQEQPPQPKPSNLDEKFRFASSGNLIFSSQPPETVLMISQNKKLRKLNA